jgi:hypothetical protein
VIPANRDNASSIKILKHCRKIGEQEMCLLSRVEVVRRTQQDQRRRDHTSKCKHCCEVGVRRDDGVARVEGVAKDLLIVSIQQPMVLNVDAS